MNRYRVSPEARADLDEIWLYIAHDNPEAADKYIHAIVSRFPTLASMPPMGRERPELASGLRSFVVGRHVIFYRPLNNGVEIARVLFSWAKLDCWPVKPSRHIGKTLTISA